MLPVILLAIIGAYAAFCWLYEYVLPILLGVTWGLLKQLLCGHESLAKRYGKWAVITGATDGIGRGYADHLARAGMNLVLISRSEAKLVKVAREIQDLSSVQIKWVVADFSEGGEKIYTKIRKELEPLEVGILVNNVGMGTEVLKTFENFPENLHLNLLNVNAVSMLRMTYMVLPKMKQSRRGIIVNVSSALALFPAPYAVTYSASKSFGHALTLALQQELRGTGVECQLVVPGFVRTNMVASLDVTKFGGKLLPNADQFGRCATWLIGKVDITSGHWFQEVQNLLSRLIPASLFMSATAAYFKYLEDKQAQESRNLKTVSEENKKVN